MSRLEFSLQAVRTYFSETSERRDRPEQRVCLPHSANMAGELVVGILYNLFLPLLLLAGESAYSFNSYGCDVFLRAGVVIC